MKWVFSFNKWWDSLYGAKQILYLLGFVAAMEVLMYEVNSAFLLICLPPTIIRWYGLTHKEKQ